MITRLPFVTTCAAALTLGAIAIGQEDPPQNADGPYSVVIQVSQPAGGPAAGQPYELRAGPELPPIAKGEIPDDGRIAVKGLAGGEDTVTYTLYVGRPMTRTLVFRLRGDALERELDATTAPKQGDTAPDFVMSPLFGDGTSRLSDFRGQVVFLDFWASWCAPCREPMAKNNDMMARRGREWEGKATVVALSIDETIEDARKHAEEMDWTELEYYWPAGEMAGWNSEAPVKYGIDSIPMALLIDANGEIVWRGNICADPEPLIERLLEKE